MEVGALESHLKPNKPDDSKAEHERLSRSEWESISAVGVTLGTLLVQKITNRWILLNKWYMICKIAVLCLK